MQEPGYPKIRDSENTTRESSKSPARHHQDMHKEDMPEKKERKGFLKNVRQSITLETSYPSSPTSIHVDNNNNDNYDDNNNSNNASPTLNINIPTLDPSAPSPRSPLPNITLPSPKRSTSTSPRKLQLPHGRRSTPDRTRRKKRSKSITGGIFKRLEKPKQTSPPVVNLHPLPKPCDDFSDLSTVKVEFKFKSCTPPARRATITRSHSDPQLSLRSRESHASLLSGGEQDPRPKFYSTRKLPKSAVPTTTDTFGSLTLSQSAGTKVAITTTTASTSTSTNSTKADVTMTSTPTILMTTVDVITLSSTTTTLATNTATTDATLTTNTITLTDHSGKTTTAAIIKTSSYTGDGDDDAVVDPIPPPVVTNSASVSPSSSFRDDLINFLEQHKQDLKDEEEKEEGPSKQKPKQQPRETTAATARQKSQQQQQQQQQQPPRSLYPAMTEDGQSDSLLYVGEYFSNTVPAYIPSSIFLILYLTKYGWSRQTALYRPDQTLSELLLPKCDKLNVHLPDMMVTDERFVHIPLDQKLSGIPNHIVVLQKKTDRLTDFLNDSDDLSPEPRPTLLKLKSGRLGKNSTGSSSLASTSTMSTMSTSSTTTTTTASTTITTSATTDHASYSLSLPPGIPSTASSPLSSPLTSPLASPSSSPPLTDAKRSLSKSLRKRSKKLKTNITPPSMVSSLVRTETPLSSLTLPPRLAEKLDSVCQETSEVMTLLSHLEEKEESSSHRIETSNSKNNKNNDNDTNKNNNDDDNNKGNNNATVVSNTNLPELQEYLSTLKHLESCIACNTGNSGFSDKSPRVPIEVLFVRQGK